MMAWQIAVSGALDPGPIASAALALLLIGLAGYGWWLWRAPGAPVARPPSGTDAGEFALDVIVPVFNERQLLPGKLQNLEQLECPASMRIRFFVVDGHSTDGSADIVAQRTRHDARFVLLATPRPDKTAQINAALRRATAPWVLVTDADARLPREALVEVRRAALADPSVTVIGAPVVPIGAHPVEQLHYRVGNWLRSREARRGSASMVLGPCYAFRRALLDQLPSNVLADDVYVAWFAASVGGRVGLAEALAAELRTPRAIGELFRHKTRRGLGVLRELLRFLPRVTRMPPAMRAMLLCRAALFLLVPPLLAGALSDIRIAAAAAPLGILPLLLVATLQRPSAIVSASALIVVLVGAAAVSLAAYPFSRVTACHSRLREQVDEST